MKPLHVVGKYFNTVFCYFIYKKIVILIFNCKKMLFCNKRSFVCLKKTVFDERFFAVVDSVFSCTWLLLFLRGGKARARQLIPIFLNGIKKFL